jgi:predicted ABC-type ATPase
VSSPILTVIAGANGCGKSTLTKWARAFFQETAILDPDAVAVDLQAQTSVDVSPIEAGKRVLASAENYLQKGVSFSVETTLSGSTYLKMLVEAKRLGFRTCLFYIGTESLEINISRVKARVLKGGHDVPLEDQTRRYGRSFRNLPRALGLADEGVLLDNSSELGHRVVALKLEGRRMLLFEPLPEWAEFLRN